MMNRTVIKNGLISTGILVVINLISLAAIGTDPAYYEVGELIGYAAIVSSLILVILGIREFEFQNDQTSFMKRMGIGMGITLFPSVVFGLYNVIYSTWIDPDFMETYTQYSLDKMQADMSAEEFEIAKTQMLEQMAMFDNLFLQFLIMFITVFVIGLIFSILTSLYFQVRPINYARKTRED